MLSWTPVPLVICRQDTRNTASLVVDATHEAFAGAPDQFPSHLAIKTKGKPEREDEPNRAHVLCKSRPAQPKAGWAITCTRLASALKLWLAPQLVGSEA